MKKIITLLIAFMTIATAHAMESETSPQRKRDEWRRNIGAEPDSFPNFPQKITVLDWNEPITDELLEELNPDWKLVQHQMNDNELTKVLSSPGSAYQWQARYHQYWPIMRSVIAVCVWLGARPLDYSSRSTDSAIIWSCDEQDYSLTKYLLEKGANPNASMYHNEICGNSPLTLVRTLPLTELLVQHGATFENKRAEKHILEHCCLRAPSSVLRFYLERKLLPAYLASLQGPCKLLHWADWLQRALLIDAGLDPNCQDENGNTALHSSSQFPYPSMAPHNKIDCIALLEKPNKKTRDGFYEFLLALKQHCKQLYAIKDLRQKIFDEAHACQVTDLLSIKNNENKIAQDYWLEGLSERMSTDKAISKIINKPFDQDNEDIYDLYRSAIDLLDPHTCTPAKIAQAKHELAAEKLKLPAEKNKKPEYDRNAASLHKPENSWF